MPYPPDVASASGGRGVNAAGITGPAGTHGRAMNGTTRMGASSIVAS